MAMSVSPSRIVWGTIALKEAFLCLGLTGGQKQVT